MKTKRKPQKLTVEIIQDMPAGREMDEWVALLIFGWKRGDQAAGEGVWRRPTDDSRYASGFKDALLLPPHSTDIAAAWLVADWLRKHHGQFSLQAGIDWHCMADVLKPWGSGATPMEAICRAALLTTLKEGKR